MSYWYQVFQHVTVYSRWLFTLATRFVNASKLFFEVFRNFFVVKVNGIVFSKFNFMVLNLSFFCLCELYTLRTCFQITNIFFIISYSNVLPLAFKIPFFSLAYLLFFQHYFKNSLWISTSAVVLPVEPFVLFRGNDAK